MVRKLRKAALVASVVIGALLISGAPARADTLAGRCYGNVEGSIWLDAAASYTVDGSGWQNWYAITGVIRNDPFAPNSGVGNKNNVDLYLYQDGAQNWTSFSPDNIPLYGGWSANPNRSLPPWSAVQARVTGIFDKPLQSDPRCTWWSDIV
jgi:hypothetical protein